MTRWTCSARLAAKRRASVRGVTRSTSERTRRSDAPSGVPSGSAVATTDTPRAASQACRPSTWVDLPAPSTPSTVIRRPRGPSERAAAMVASRYHTRAEASRAGGRHPQEREDTAAELGDLALGELPRGADGFERKDRRRIPQGAPAVEVGRRVDDEAGRQLGWERHA